MSLTPEEVLLVEAARGRTPAPGDVAPGGLRWDPLLSLAEFHRMWGLLWEHLQTRRPGIDVPADVAGTLRERTRATTARNLNLGFERDRILRTLAAEEIDVVLLKGAALVECVYDHPGLRPMVDLDLLVPAADLQRAHETIRDRLGYAAVGAGPDDHDGTAPGAHHRPLVKRGVSVMVELHHRVLHDRPAYDAAGVLARSVALPGPPMARVPSPEDLVLHAAAHFGFDLMRPHEAALCQLADLAHIDAHWDIDWALVGERAREYEVADRLFLALAAADTLFGGLAPADVTEALRPESSTPEMERRFLRQRVLRSGPVFPVEELARGRRRIFTGDAGLQRYVRAGEVSPSRVRLRARRAAWIARRAAREMPGPRALVTDWRLKRWLETLRR